jgi:Ca-activated chloride channel family protein
MGGKSILVFTLRVDPVGTLSTFDSLRVGGVAMRWQTPYFLWLIILLLPIFAWECFRIRNQFLKYQKQSNRSLFLTYLKTVLLGLGVLFLVIALAGPRYGIIPQPQTLSGLEIVFALDVSDSMRAKDIAESRLKKSISEIQKVMGGLNNDLAGFVTFEGSATAVCPLTQDYDALNYFLGGVAQYREETPGTNLSTAFNEALKIFNFTSDSGPAAKVLIYFTDGENNQGNLSDLKTKALKNNILILPVGVGQTHGTTIPEGTGILMDRKGRPVMTRLELNYLKQIATRKVFVINQSYQSVAGELLNEIKNFQRKPFNSQNINQYQSQSIFFSWLALLCLFLSFTLPATKVIFSIIFFFNIFY